MVHKGLQLCLVVQLMLIVSLQLSFWSSEEGFFKVKQLEQEIVRERAELQLDQRRNTLLATEVSALKNHSDALEEKARLDLGLIREGETFFQFR